MRFIHCSDLHLDSPMESNLSAEKARERNGEICQTFARLADYAREQEVTAVLIAGDLFDSGRVTGKTADFVLSVIEEAGEVDFLYLRGNHDESLRAFSGRTLPGNLKTFSREWTYYTYGGVCVAGAEPAAEDGEALYQTLRLPPEGINIVMLHGLASAQMGEGLVCLPQLRERHIRYLALGHLHSYQAEPLDAEGTCCYCGCLEGRGFDECGEKGFVLLETEGRQIRSTFVPFARRRLYDVPVDITGLGTVSRIRQAMEEASADIGKEHLVKFTLRGLYEPDTLKDLRFLRQLMEPRFYFVRVKDESRLRIEKSSYENDVSLKGEFIRMVMALERSEEEKEQLICWGIQALSGEEITL